MLKVTGVTAVLCEAALVVEKRVMELKSVLAIALHRHVAFSLVDTVIVADVVIAGKVAGVVFVITGGDVSGTAVENEIV